MSMRPAWCPPEVWEAAYPFTVPAAETATRNLDYDNVTDEVHAIRSAVARAILAERERCAKVVETTGQIVAASPSHIEQSKQHRAVYAAAIRTGAAHG